APDHRGANAALAGAPRRAAGARRKRDRRAARGPAAGDRGRFRSLRELRGRRLAVRLLLATHNDHKRREFERLLDGAGTEKAVALDVLEADVELPPEDGETFAENALGKARAAAAQLDRVTIADDSGIAADALGGAPGVRSARYAGEHASDEENLAKLLA